MRRRPVVIAPSEKMDRGAGKNQKSRLCFLALLSAFFWILLLYFHFVVLGGHAVDESIKLSLEDKPVNLPVVRKFAPSRVVDATKVDVKSIREPTKPVDQQPKSTAKPEVQNFPFVKALKTVENKSDPCGGRYIFVHDLPSRFNEDMLKECKSLSLWTNMCKFTTNAGLGPPLENVEGVFSDTGWYATNQFAVDVIFSNRMKQYDCLTKDSSIASAFFVPFYAGFDIARYLWGYNISTRDRASLDLVDWLEKRPEWGVMGGRDHFLVAGRITWDFRRLSEEETDWGNKLLFLPAAKNMSMLVVESSPWNANDFGIPYPTYFHPAKDDDVFIWQDRMRKLERKWLFSFAGAPRPDNPKSIRGQIIDQCKKSKVCKLLECDFGESKCHSPSSIMQMFQSSLFCLQPQGDSYTRRSAFDAMLAGCIPVFFHPGSAYTQYTWHLPKNFTRYSVFIPEDDIRKRNVSIEERLSQISPEQLKLMQEEVISMIPRLVYADPRSKLETLKDAFDVSVQAIIDKVTKLRKDIIEGHTDKNFIEENSWKYALLEDGQREVGPHEWDPFFSKPKDGDSGDTSAGAAKNSWKNEQRDKSLNS
ncbi:xyloglucan galactosyltransferase MUR3-like [Cucurbita maxima]|uniref:Xyloglucan galactosyltransferase MUR3-like n=1 Tax=Cucurbita maxima TaxID=3661 RepID=A0A6J1K5L4_CUCMA|nr:xyloglucan galactosyltransferase MUR3-like [Cucurbita maxima]XP_022996045.1 xyloglucan galactosyltransferase MUR3-like [Cucurbita maxima]